jgi:hypothetical protein
MKKLLLSTAFVTDAVPKKWREHGAIFSDWIASSEMLARNGAKLWWVDRLSEAVGWSQL